LGRRRMLIVGAILMAGAGLAFAFTHHVLFLVLAGTIGVISPSGHEVGPFFFIAQTALLQVVSPPICTGVVSWYMLAGSIATAAGALAGGGVTRILPSMAGISLPESYRVVVVAYALFGVLLALLFFRLTSAAEVHKAPAVSRSWAFFGLRRSHRVVA